MSSRVRGGQQTSLRSLMHAGRSAPSTTLRAVSLPREDAGEDNP
jgi:hypothetical protein